MHIEMNEQRNGPHIISNYPTMTNNTNNNVELPPKYEVLYPT